MTKARKPVPAIADEAEERAYWERTDSTAHVDWSRAKRVRLPNLLPSKVAISLRLPVGLLEQIKRQQARRALSVADQDVAEREGGVGNAFAPDVASA